MLDQSLLARLNTPDALAILARLQRGIEKESLRVQPDRKLALTPHPAAFGAAMSHDRITTDFSEALLELITPVYTDIDTCLAELRDIHRFVYQNLDGELLWTASMPCVLGGNEDIPLAQYGSSNTARMKTAYRRGLGYRYGRKMQTIAGIHYNFSLPQALWPLLAEGADQDLITARYFALIRNFRRWSWLLIYLFGASPAVCGSFLSGQKHHLQRFDDHTLFLPHATSLRMGDLGYQSNAQKSLKVCYNLLDTYISTLKGAITTPHPDYENIGVEVDGVYRQLNSSLLQIENEFYSPIRPKRVTRSGETPLGALRERGVEYVEVRCIDVNPFEPLGISSGQVRLIDAFLLYCLLADSPPCNDAVYREIGDNQRLVVNRGREPGLQLMDQGKSRTLADWASELLDGIAQTAELLDRARSSEGYSAAVTEARASVADPDLTPSAKILAGMREQDLHFPAFVMQQAEQHRDTLTGETLSADKQTQFAGMAKRSVEARQAVESEQQHQPFAEYLAEFYAQYDSL